MAKEKCSFIMYYEWGDIIENLQTEKGYRLVTAIFNYVRKGVEPDFSNDQLMQITWIPIFNQLNRDSDSYKKKCEQNAENGKKGGEAKGEAYAKRREEQIANAISENNKIANAKNGNSEKSKIADNDNVDDSVNVSDNDSDGGNVVVYDNEPSGLPQNTTQAPSLEEVKNELLTIGFTENVSEKTASEFYQYNTTHGWKFLSYARWQDKLMDWINRNDALKKAYTEITERKTKEQEEKKKEQQHWEEYNRKYWDNDIGRYALNQSAEDFYDYVCSDRHYSYDDEVCKRIYDFFMKDEIEQLYKDDAVEIGDPERNVIRISERGKCAELIKHFNKGDERACFLMPFVWKSREDELKELDERNKILVRAKMEEDDNLPFE